MVISGVMDVVFGLCTVDSGVGVFISGITVQVEVRKKGYEDNNKTGLQIFFFLHR